MKLVVGLGNIGEKYKKNRHNMGFMAIDFVCSYLKVNLNKNNFKGEFYKDQNFILAKPHTFINLSGDFVHDICHFYKINIKDIMIISDDIDMEVGKLRFRESGSAGGHNGLKDIIIKMKTDDIKRLKIGVGRPENFLSNYVLSNFSEKQWNIISSKKMEIIKFILEFIK